jgi:HAE1 family hydrophobic/amphiphilic exporter-1
MGKLVQFAVRRPVTITIIVAVLCILGIISLNGLKVDLYPNFEIPMAVVYTSYTGAGPEDVENAISKPLESTLKSLSGVNSVTSQSSSGTSIIMLEYDWGTDLDAATLEMREQIDLISGYLPDDASKPMVIKINMNMMPVMQLALGSDSLSLAQLQKIADDIIQPRLAQIPELGQVDIGGGVTREIQVRVDRNKLENRHLSLSQVASALAQENFNQSVGDITQGSRDIFVRQLQQFESLDDVRSVAIQTAAGAVYLHDIADIVDGVTDTQQLVRVNGASAVYISCTKTTDANTVEACDAVKAALASIQSELDLNMDIDIILDQSDYINQTMNSTVHMILEGAVLAVIILFMFLRNVRSTMIISIAIPLSIIFTFILMYFSDNTLNMITLGGLALGLGRMVDDSIVVFENIFRHRSNGMRPLQAAIAGATEVGGAVFASTSTILSVFLPIVFTTGMASILFTPMAITISFALVCSLAVSLTVVPLLASRMLNDESMNPKRVGGVFSRAMDKFSGGLEALNHKYEQLISLSLHNRKKVVLIVVALLLVSVTLVPVIGAEFIPAMDSGQISVTLEVDKGSQLEHTNQIALQAETILQDVPEIDSVFTSLGSASGLAAVFSGGGGNSASLTLQLVGLSERKRSVDAVAEDVRLRLAEIEGAKVSVSATDAASFGTDSSGIVVYINGDDLEVLSQISDQVVSLVRTVEGTREVRSSLSDGDPEIRIAVDRMRAATLGLSPVQVAAEVRNALDGRVATVYRVNGEEIDVRVLYQTNEEKDVAYLNNLSIFNAYGQPVKLSQVVTFTQDVGPSSISRTDQTRRISVSASLLNRDLNSTVQDVTARIAAEISLPSGYSIDMGGSNQEMIDSFKSLALALLLSLVLIYAVMAIQYESFFYPFIIMFSIPASFIGVAFGLFLTGRTFSVIAFIGVIMMVGIVVANGILLVDYIKQLIERGIARDEAIMQGGKTRLRPILMTSLSTGLAMLPMALGIGEGAESMAPMATVVIGGLIASTMVTLVLIPVVFAIFDDQNRKSLIKRAAKRRKKRIAARAKQKQLLES